ncbi:protocadherin-11 X-linked-like [Lytechinus pictus]|uniref:protocadherin-11 X-linked-like n=1 Tax=Lytechinus pictus TaxID=7653 RepID=UPI0030BA1993
MTPLRIFLPLLIQISFLMMSVDSASDLFYYVDEEVVPGTVIGNVADDLAITVDDSTEFSLLGVPNETMYVSLDPQTGELTTVLELDREALCPGSSAPCQIEISAIELGTREVITIRVTINDTNDHAPEFDNAVTNINIPESVAPGTRFPLSGANDEDTGNNGIQGYRLSGEYADIFGLVQNEYPGGLIIIQLEVLQNLDRENKDNYQMTLIADDGGDSPQSGGTILNVTVLDSDDHSPVFDRASYEVSVDEDIGVGQQIIQVRASDPDTGTNGQIIYDFGGSVSAKIRELFEIDSESGWLLVKSDLDFEDEASHQVSVRATNNVPNPLPDFTTVTVNLNDVNDNKPRMTISAIDGVISGGRFKHILENSPEGTDLAFIRVTDVDTGDNGRARLTIEDDFERFRLEQITEGQYFLQTAAELDREDIDFYNITILAEDRGSPVLSSRKRFEVYIDDENDNFPEFSSAEYHATISENNEPGHRVATLQATDEDEFENGEVVYSLVDDRDGAFGIHPTNGVLTANVSLNRENGQYIELMIRACDRGQPQKCKDVPLTVRVLDMNDNAPTFGGELIELRIDENQPSGTLVGRAIATDADEGDNSRLRYSILTDAVFRIDEDNGRIFSTAELDREIQELYHFTVRAVDNGLSPKTATATVVVTVNDVNDHSPEFILPSANDDIRFIPVSAEPGLHIMTVESEDKDKDENAVVSYAISHGNTNGAFGIQANGQVVTAQYLEPMWEGVHDITIRATDGGSPSSSSTAVLRVVIANEDFKRSLPPANFTSLFNLTIDYYLSVNNGASSRGILNDWPMIVIISLAGSAVILVIVFLLVAARCRTKNREQGKYIVPSGEELFASRQAAKPADIGGKMSDTDSGLTSTSASNASTIQSKNIRKWRAQQERDRDSMGSSNPGSTTNLGTLPPGITGAANVDMRLGNRQMSTFGSNSDLHSESIASMTSARRTPDPDVEVQRLLRKLRRDSEDRNSEGGSGSSYDSGHGGDREIERENGYRGNLSSADGSSRRSASYPRIAALAAQNISNSQTPSGSHRHSYMASPHCTPECRTLGHSDECWMPSPSSITKPKTVQFSKHDDNRSSGGSYRSYQSNTDRPPATSPKPPNPAIAFGNVSKVTPNHKPIPKGSTNPGLGQQPPTTRDHNNYYGNIPAVIVDDERNGNALPLTPIREHPSERRSSQDAPSLVVTKPSPDKYRNNNDALNGDVRYRNDLNRGHINGVNPLHRNSMNGSIPNGGTPNGVLPNGMQNGRSNSRNSSGDSHNSSSDSVGTYSSSSAASNEMTPVRYSPDEVEAVLEKCGGDRSGGVSADGERMYTDWV